MSDYFKSSINKAAHKRLQKQQIVTLGMNETSEWCNSYVLVPKANDKVRLCLDPAELNKALIRPVHRGPTLNDILLRLAGIKYLTLLNARSGYHYYKSGEKPSYLITLPVHFADTDT